MRANKYLYNVSLDDNVHFVIFNGFNKENLILEEKALASMVKLINNPDAYASSHPKILQRLVALKFIVEDDFDERAILKAERESFIHESEYKTTILPTFECNYKCWYCLQEHEPVVLDYTRFDLMIKHIKKYMLENSIQEYVLSWFGGEPLTQPKVIEYIAPQLISFCEEHKIDFSSGVTTNGALLNIDNIKLLQKCKVDYYQIAIDGDEKTHNKNKQDCLSDSSFRLILNNIVNLLRMNSDAKVTLRINYTLATLKSESLVTDITKYIPQEYRNRILVDLQKVWQVNEQNVSISLLRNLQEKLIKCGFELSIQHVFSMCYVEKEHYNMFYYNGGVEKCDKRPIGNLRGHLNSEGDIVWTEKPIFSDYDLFDEKCVCNNCHYYPLCYCECPILREDRIKENHGKILCGHQGRYELLEHRIKDYCWRVINNKKLKR
ncbi:MAG: radical SAM protein [Segatella copri]